MFKVGQTYIHPKFRDVEFLVTNVDVSDQIILDVIWFNFRGYMLGYDTLKMSHLKAKEFREERISQHRLGPDERGLWT